MAARRPSGRIIVAVDRKIAHKMQDLSPLMKSLTSKILRRLLGRHQGDLGQNSRRRRLLGHEHQFEVVKGRAFAAEVDPRVKPGAPGRRR
jgi:hypothetical protein